jgi:cytochrome c551/c552
MNLKTGCFISAFACVIFSACNNNNPKPGQDTTPVAYQKPDTVVVSQGINSKGIGRFKDVPLTHPLDAAMATKGQTLYSAKCSACHKLTDEKLVGPGWKGVTDKHTPEWIMNFITNTEVMLDKDLAAQAEVVTCLVRMPNQDLTDEQARQILEFQRQNDGKK